MRRRSLPNIPNTKHGDGRFITPRKRTRLRGRSRNLPKKCARRGTSDLAALAPVAPARIPARMKSALIRLGTRSLCGTPRETGEGLHAALCKPRGGSLGSKVSFDVRRAVASWVDGFQEKRLDGHRV